MMLPKLFKLVIKNLICLSIFFAPWVIAVEKPLYLLGDDDNFPSCYLDENNQLAGSDIDILAELSRRTGIPFEIELMPWKRVLGMIQSGETDGGFPLAKTPTREGYALYTDTPLRRSFYGIFSGPESTLQVTALPDLYGKKVGIQRGFFISPNVERAIKQGLIEIYETDKVEQLVKMVNTNRLDAFVAKPAYVDKIAVETGIKTSWAGEVKTLEKVYLVFSRKAFSYKNQARFNLINAELLEMAKDGTIERIVFKHTGRRSP